MLLTLTSSDDVEFKVERDMLKHSGTIDTLIANMNLDDVEEGVEPMPIPLPNVSSTTLNLVIDYLKQHKDEEKRPADEEERNDIKLEGWDKDFIEKLDQKTDLLTLVVAANYLDIKGLLEIACRRIADTLKGKTPEQIRADYDLQNEFTPEEEEKIRKENSWTDE